MLLVGTLGFHALGYGWIDAFYNAAITSNLCIDKRPKTVSQKLFISFYTIFAAIILISLISAIVSYIFTLSLHK